jgi:hypothetical protein
MSFNLSRRDALASMAALLASGWTREATAEEQPASVSPGAGGASINRVFTGSDGRSHLGEIELSEHEVRAGVNETEWLDAVRVSLRLLNPDPSFKTQPRHVAPRRQLAVILAGTLEVECSPSEIRRFGPSSLVLLEDTTGEGHITRIVEAPVSFVQIELEA